MYNNLYKRPLGKVLIISLGLFIGMLFWLNIVPQADAATVPSGIENQMRNRCQNHPSAYKNNSVVLLGQNYFGETSSVNSVTGAGTTTVYAAEMLCVTYWDGRDNAKDVRIYITNITPTPGSGSLDIPNKNWYPPDIAPGDFDNAYGDGPNNANIDLNPGQNCWDIEQRITATFGPDPASDFEAGVTRLCIYFNPDKPPKGQVTSITCDRIKGWAYDPDWGGRIRVHIYIDGSGYDIGQVDSNDNFNWPVPSQWKDGNSHNVKAYAIGVDSNGNQNGNNPLIGSGTFGQCWTRPPPPTVKPVCVNGKSSVTVKWNSGGSQGANGYNIDLDADNNWSNGNAYEVRGSGTTSLTDDYFNGSYFQGPTRLEQGKTYQVRIFYKKSGLHSQSPDPSFKALNCDRPPTISATVQCPQQRIRVKVSDPDGGTSTVQYRVNNSGSWQTLPANNNPIISMSSYNQYDIHEVRIRTRGTALPGSVTSTYYYAPPDPVRYGGPGGSTHACLHRDFTLTPNAGPVNLTPDDEVATGAEFRSQITADVTQSGGPSHIKGAELRRNFYIRRVDGSTDNLSSPTKSGGDPRTVNVPRSSPFSVIDSGQLNPTANIGDKVCQTTFVRPTGNKIDTVGNIVPSGGNKKSKTSPESCERVVAKPYFRVYNSDASAGFTAACEGWTNTAAPSSGSGRILAHNKAKGQGSAVQLAAIALSTIDQFTSATGRTASPEPEKGLTFANSGGGTYGAGFGAGFCAPDYFDKSDEGTTTPLGSTFNPATHNGTKDGRYKKTGNVDITGGKLPAGKQVALYVKGNVRIMNNITYAGSGGAWNKIKDIPNFTLIVKGNIYIHHSVREISGFFVAQPDLSTDTGGQIYTCAKGFGSPTYSQVANECRDNTLVINGAFTSKQVRLLRGTGTLKNSCPAEDRRGDGCGGPVNPNDMAAERFIFSPEAWLSSALGAEHQDNEPYDSISALSPIL